MAVPRNNDPNDSRDRSDGGRNATTGNMSIEALADAELYDIPVNVDFLKIVQYAETQNQTNAGHRNQAWQRSLRAYHNEHSSRSKYLGRLYSNRTKLFRPKTRSAVRKNLASVGNALFSTSDVVSIRAEHDSDPRKLASAAVWNEVLNYRLDRTSTKAGIPWFLIAIGASMDAQLHGICCSKQCWEYEATTKTRQVEVRKPLMDDLGQPVFSPDGIPAEIISQEDEEYEKISKDRPMILLIPPENVILDESAPWYDPAQLSGYLTIQYPMTVNDAKAMMKSPGKTDETAWLDVPDEMLKTGSSEYDSQGVRLARQQSGQDRQSRSSGPGGEHGIVWMHENFVRFDGVDYHFWSIGSISYASKIRPTEEAYPEQLGARPYTIGYGAIESHTIYPMSPVESWQPLQQEANDIVNLQLDVMKQWAAPIAKVRQGRMFDWNSLQKRGAGGIDLIVKDADDITFDRAPDISSSTYMQSDRINADMDDLSGSFSQGSVATNRALNETVGGMRLMSGSANSVTEFDLRLWVETWVEPVLRQVVRALQHYETDEAILSIAGERSKMVERFGVDSLTDEDLIHEASVSVNVGIGASDPMQRLQKLGMGFQMLGTIAPFFNKKKKIDAEEIIKEVMGAIGFNDGMRFFVDDEGGDKNPEMMMEMAKLEIEKGKLSLEAEMNSEDNETRKLVEQMQGRFSLIETLINRMADMNEVEMQNRVNRANALTKGMGDMFGQMGQGARRPQQREPV
tara:strand:+ start:1012 stop:3231 length:2220 start_codon:yes stop_codon:yes gene_type:complete